MAVASGKPSLGDGSRGAGAAPSNSLTRHMTAVNCRQAATTSHFSAGGAAVSCLSQSFPHSWSTAALSGALSQSTM